MKASPKLMEKRTVDPTYDPRTDIYILKDVDRVPPVVAPVELSSAPHTRFLLHPKGKAR